MALKLASDADILHQIELFCKERGIGLSTFGRSAIGDANLVANLRAGRSLTLKTANAVADFMASYAGQGRAA